MTVVQSTYLPADVQFNSRIPALDGVRGLAILGVMVYHFLYYGGTPLAEGFAGLLNTVGMVGWSGVDLFFVLSGFLITGILFDTRKSRYYFRNFFARRILRIFPLYYAALVLFCIVLPQLWPTHAGLRWLTENQGWYWSYLTNIQITWQGWPAFGAIGHFWSLAVEEQFYLLWPFVVFLFERRKLIVICFICIVGSFCFRAVLLYFGHVDAIYVLMPARMDAFAVGALLALVARNPKGLMQISRWAKPLLGLFSVALGALILWRGTLHAYDPLVQVFGYSVLAFLYGAMVGSAITTSPAGPIGKFLASPVLVFFGHYSYALYVFHHPLLFLRPNVFSYDTLPTVLGSQLPSQLIFVAVGCGISILFALVSWHLLEKRFLGLKRYFPYQPKDPGILQRTVKTKRVLS